MTKFRTHYDNLKVARNAPNSVVKAAYKALIQQHHPDKNQESGQEAYRITKIIIQSYEILIDPVKRKEHDRWIAEQEAKKNNGVDKIQANFTSTTGTTKAQPENPGFGRQAKPKTNDKKPPIYHTISKAVCSLDWLWCITLLLFAMTIFGLNSYLFAKNTPDDLAIIVLTYFPVGLIVWFLFQFLAGRNKGKVKASASFLVLFCALILSGQVGYTNMQQEYEQATSKTSSFSALKLSDKASALYDNSKFAEIISLAEQGDPVAELFLARMYDKGKGVSKNQESASSGYKKTYADLLIRAENGDAVAQFFLGRMLKLDADFDFKIDSISTVINKSTAEVKTNNSTLSSSVPQNDEHAIFWLTKSAEQNYTNAQNELGNIYRYAKGVSKNYPQAVFWYTKAAENGLIEAQSKLAQLYSQENENSRDGFPPDYQKAFYWYKKASEQGDADSLNALGHMSAAGKGVPKNVQQAIYWYTKAAELGKTDAQYQIGMLFYGGLGVPQNYILANMWFTIASANGNDMAFNSKESVSKNMSSDQIQHAQILADKWMINHPKQPLKP